MNLSKTITLLKINDYHTKPKGVTTKMKALNENILMVLFVLVTVL